MDLDNATAILYAITFALLMAHQADSAYWREWELFKMPGGPQLNLALNLLLLLAGLAGFAAVLESHRAGNAFALVLSAAGAFAFAIHFVFLARGDHRFRLPASIGVIVVLLPVSAALAAITLAAARG